MPKRTVESVARSLRLAVARRPWLLLAATLAVLALLGLDLALAPGDAAGGAGAAPPPDPLGQCLPALLVGAAAFVLLVLRRQLRDEPRWVGWALVAVTAAGAALRLAIARPAPMNAFAFQRVLPLADALFRGPLLAWVSASTGRAIYLTDVISWVNFALAAATPPVFFAHARYLLRDARRALAAAALVALLPMHIRFARSDVQFIASLLSSSFTFVVLYGALTEPGRRWRALCFALLPVLSLATYSTRPENIVFLALDLGALLLYARTGVPRARLALAAALIVAAAAWSIVGSLLQNFGSNVAAGLSPRTLVMALRVAFSPRMNTLINPWVTPPLIAPLAVVGWLELWRSGQRPRAVFLGAWLAVFFVVHSYVYPQAVAMQARYHLHLVSPLLLLVAAAVPWWLRRPLAQRAAIAAWVVLAPLLHLGFERDVDYTEMHEAAFLRSLRHRIGTCPVLEFNPPLDPLHPSVLLASPVRRMTTALRGGAISAAPTAHLGPVPAAVRAEGFASPPACLFYYEGASCAGHRAPGHALAAPCEALRRRATLAPVAAADLHWHWYDDAVAATIVPQPDGSTLTVPLLPEGTPLRLGLYRVTAIAGGVGGGAGAPR